VKCLEPRVLANLEMALARTHTLAKAVGVHLDPATGPPILTCPEFYPVLLSAFGPGCPSGPQRPPTEDGWEPSCIPLPCRREVEKETPPAASRLEVREPPRRHDGMRHGGGCGGARGALAAGYLAGAGPEAATRFGASLLITGLMNRWPAQAGCDQLEHWGG